MKRRAAPRWVLATFVVLLQACTLWEYEIGDPLTPAVVTELDSGASLGAVLQLLGPPNRISATDGGYVLAWEYWQIREDSLGLSLGFAGADALSIDWGDANVSGQFLLLAFDGDHRMVDRSVSVWDGSAGGGVGLQPPFGVDLTNIEDLTRRMPHHEWGGEWLKRLPEALNLPSRPDTGQSGIQQRGTPAGIGQQSLEMD